MAVRKFRRVRKPVYRRRRFVRRRRIQGRRRISRGQFRVKLTETQLVKADVAKNEVKELHVDLTNFDEFKRLGSNFEYCQPRLVVQTIIPQQNVSNTSTSAVPPYVMFPYHKNIPSSGVGFSDFLSMDKAKLYRGTQVGRMAYVPSIGLLNNIDQPVGGGDWTKHFRTDLFRPKLRCQDMNGGSIDLPRIYCGGAVFAGNASITGESYFFVKTDVYLTFYNQNTLAKNVTL